MISRKLCFVVAAVAAATLDGRRAMARQGGGGDSRHQRIRHVLLLSVDGLHASDLADYVSAHPASALAQLSGHGVTYSQASTSMPSDSFPGLIAMVTGGSPAVTGVYYDDSYDRLLLPPNLDADGNPLGGSDPGTEIVYDETIDLDLTRPDAGGGINPDRLPRDAATDLPVYPHTFLRVNTIFEVAKQARLRTAWSDKHPAYDIVNGPSGHGVDDLFCPEVNSYTPESADSTHIVNTSSLVGTENYDDTKVAAILNEIAGFDHTGKGRRVGTPAIFGMNFQAVSVGQKLIGNVDPDGSTPSDPNMINGGYLIDSNTGTPVPSPMVAAALDHTDASIGSMLAALDSNGLRDSTLVIVSAKHGQSPIDPSKLRSGLTGFLLSNAIKDLVSPVATIAQLTKDDVALLWLAHQDQTDAATKALQAGQAGAFIQTIYSGTSLKLGFPDPATDSRVPDIIVQPQPGVIYSNSTAKDEEHGGFCLDDVNVALLVSNPNLGASTVQSPVETTQIAPSILRALGLDPNALQAVQAQKTQALPGLF
jgi:type I phosphodiesterase/nucleotide pyrophosphatase